MPLTLLTHLLVPCFMVGVCRPAESHDGSFKDIKHSAGLYTDDVAGQVEVYKAGQGGWRQRDVGSA